MSKVFFTNGNIIDVVNEKIFKGSVIAEDGVICAVGEDLECPEGAEVVDFGGNFVSPGLFNCHTHVLMSGEANPDYADSDAVLTIKALVKIF